MNRTSSLSRPGPRGYVPAPLPVNTGRVTLLIILGSETAFFGTLIAAYLYLRIRQPGTPFVPGAPGQLIVPAVNTVLLLISALTASFASGAIRRGSRSRLTGWLWVTLALGLVFIAGQAFEYIRSGMTPADQAFGGVFLTLMGFHALHLVAGAVVLGLVLVRIRWGDFSARRHAAVDTGIWFWYYVVGVWVVLFSVLYLI